MNLRSSAPASLRLFSVSVSTQSIKLDIILAADARDHCFSSVSSVRPEMRRPQNNNELKKHGNHEVEGTGVRGSIAQPNMDKMSE